MKKILLMMGLIVSLVTNAQVIYTSAGTGSNGNDGNGGLATAARFANPKLICKDVAGNIYFTDAEWSVLRKVDVAGIITEVASDMLIDAAAMCIDVAGNNIYWSSIFEGRIFKLDLSTGINTLVVGGGSNKLLDDNIHTATQDSFNLIHSLCIDANNNLFVSTSYTGWGYIFKVTPAGNVSVYLGSPTGVPASPYNMNDVTVGDTASRVNYYVGQMCMDNANNIYFIEGYSNTGKKAIRKIAGTYPNMITRIANTGSYGPPGVYNGNGGLALNAEFDAFYIATDANSNLYISSKFRVLNINATTHIIKAIAGDGTDGSPNYPTLGDNGLATNADLNPKGICSDANGANVYFADPLNSRIRRVFTATNYNGNVSCPITMLGTTGANNVCVGSNITLTNSSVIPTGGSGVWSSIAGLATIDPATGIVTGKNIGTAVIKYSVKLGAICKKDTLFNIIVNGLPATPSIGYKAPFSNPQKGAPYQGFCVGKVFGVLGTPSTGVWSTTGCISVTTAGIATINTTGAGSLTYTYTNGNGCSNSRTMTGAGYTCANRGAVNIEQGIIKSDFTLYPNPAKTVVNLNLQTLIGTGTIIITDLYGKTVKIQPLSMGNNTIEIANLNKGFYTIRTITNEGVISKKLVVE